MKLSLRDKGTGGHADVAQAKEMFEEMISTLPTKTLMEEMFAKQNNLIETLLKRIDEQDKTIAELSMRVNTLEKLRSQDLIDHDDTRQYIRRTNVRINGVEFAEDETNEDVITRVQECHAAVEVPCPPTDFYRAHRVGKPYLNEQKKKVQSIIVKYRSWATRSDFFKKRPRAYVAGKKNEKPTEFTCQLDLTKRRYDLLKDVNKAKVSLGIRFAFNDINCNLVAKDQTGRDIYFNTMYELRNKLGLRN